MTISTETSSSGPYFGNNVTTVFPYDFKIVDERHVRVVFIDSAGNVSDLSLDDGDYTVTGVGSEDGGNIVKASALLTGQTLTIVRSPPLTQETSLANQGPYNANVVEARLDLMVMQIQSVSEATGRALTVEPGQPKPSLELIAAAEAFAGAAQESAEAANDDAEAADASAVLAGKFANNPEDQEVIPGSGLFSSYHFMMKAQALWTAALAGFASAIHGATAKTALVGADELGFWDSVSNGLRKITLNNFWAQSKWKTVKIGELYYANTALTGVDVPPVSDPEVTFVELTAGLTGSGNFNNGKLTSESVSGSAPLVSASAVISVSGSPMNGQTIRLLNTEGRIVRPSTSPNTLQDDQGQGHWHSLDTQQGQRGVSSPSGTVDQQNAASAGGANVLSDRVKAPITDGVNGTPRMGNETRMKNIGAKAYMRVK